MNAKEESRYEQLRRLGQELHIPISEAFWEVEVRDGKGKIVQSLRQRSHSWVRNAYNHMFAQLAGKNANDALYGAGKLNVKDTAGTLRSASTPIGQSDADVDGTSYGYRGPAGNDTWGIQVGSGANPENFEDHQLQTKIGNGVGAGQPGGGGIKLGYTKPIPYMDDVAADFPELKIILAHPSFPWAQEGLAMIRHKPNVFMDLSGWSPLYFDPIVMQYATTICQDKVLFGSDWPVITPERWLKDWATYNVDPAVDRKIMRDNAAKLLGREDLITD